MQNPSAEHQKLVNEAINFFTQNGFIILEVDNNPQFPTPNQHGKYRPDIVMKSADELLHIVEAKTSNDLYSLTTKEEFLNFSNRIMSSNSPNSPILVANKPVPFHIIVYKIDLQKLNNILRELNLLYLINTRIFVHWYEE